MNFVSNLHNSHGRECCEGCTTQLAEEPSHLALTRYFNTTTRRTLFAKTLIKSFSTHPSPGGFAEDELPELIQRPVPVRYRVLHRLVHLRVRLVVPCRFEHRIPPKVRGSPRRYDFPVCGAGENLRFAPRPVDVGEDALRVRGLVLVPGEHLVQSIVPELIEEPLDVRSW